MTWNIAGKNVLVTGGTSGIGRATAEQLARLGARVTISSRTLTAASKVADELSAPTGSVVAPAEIDLGSSTSVRAFASAFLENNDRLDVLVNNAGTMGGSRRVTDEGVEWTMAVNHLGPFLLTTSLLTLLLDSAPARVINVSSENHRAAKGGLDLDDLAMTQGYSPSKAYAASKLANILFTVELERRYGSEGITARAVHPGVVATNFGKGPGSPRWMGLAMRMLSPFLASPEKGAATSVHLATAPAAELDGGLYWSSSKPKDPIPAALDPEAARRLWERSSELVDGG